MPSFVPGASAMSCSDYNCGTVLHGIFRIQADDDAFRGQVRSPPSAQNGLLRRSATEQIWDSGRMTGKWEFIGSSIGLVPTNGLGVPEADLWTTSRLAGRKPPIDPVSAFA